MDPTDAHQTSGGNPPYFFRGPIAALEFVDERTLLAAQGTSLLGYSIAKKQVVFQNNNVFTDFQKVTGLKLIRSALGLFALVLGEMQIKVFELLKNSEDRSISAAFCVYEHRSGKKDQAHTQDKLIRVLCEISEDGSVELTNLYAHNYVEAFTAKLNSAETALKMRSFCEEECILYSGDLKKQDASTFLVVSGTVFRSLLIWQVNTSGSELKKKETVLHRLLGHTGVIFDTLFLSSAEGQTRIASVSDDRSLRVWSQIVEGDQFTQDAELYGHRARIWCVRELNGMLATVSEDATCKLWDNRHDVERSQKAIETFKGHFGKNVRGLAIFQNGSTELLATGGEDSAIKVYNVQAIKQQKVVSAEAQVQTLRLPLPSGELPPESTAKLTKAEKLKFEYNKVRNLEVAFAGEGETDPVILASTSRGSIFMIRTGDSSSRKTEVQQVYQDKQERSLQDTKVVQMGSYILSVSLLGNGDALVLLGDLRTNQFKEIFLDQLNDIKLLSVYLLGEPVVRNLEGGVLEAETEMVLCDGRMRAHLFKFRIRVGDRGLEAAESLIQKQRTFSVKSNAQFTCACLCKNILLLGDTKGNLNVFNFSKQAENIEPYQIFKVISHDRIISIFFNAETNSLLTTSKDNFMNHFTFSEPLDQGEVDETASVASNMSKLDLESPELPRIQKVQQVKEEELNIIYNVFEKREVGQLKRVLLGFNGNFAYIWNQTEGIQILSVDTKGGNRPIRLALKSQGINSSAFGRTYLFTYAAGDQIYIHNSWQDKPEVGREEDSIALEESMHGREILAACAIHLGQEKTLVLTGSEDTYLKVCRFDQGSQRLSIEQTFSCHVGSIRTLAKTRISPNEYVVVSAGSRLEANIFLIRTGTPSSPGSFEINHVCHYLRTSESNKSVQDFRVMASAIFTFGSKSQVFVAFGTSFGQLLFFKVNFFKKRLEAVPEASVNFTNASVLSMKKMKLSSNEIVLAVGLSDGSVSIIEVRSHVELKVTASEVTLLKEVHDFGVNCIDAKLVCVGEKIQIVTASGGDDQQLAINSLALVRNEAGQLTLQKVSRHKQYGHTTCVKGITLSKKEAGRFEVKSASYDQRFKSWGLEIDDGTITLNKGMIQRNCLSDINGMIKVKAGASDERLSVLIGQGVIIYN